MSWVAVPKRNHHRNVGTSSQVQGQQSEGLRCRGARCVPSSPWSAVPGQSRSVDRARPGSTGCLTTHSVNLLAGLQPRDIVRVEKRAGKTIAYQSPGTLSDPDFARFINADTAEMFFAQKVLLVEGDTERFLLPPLSSMLSQNGKTLDFNQQQISVVVMDGKDNIVNFLKILDEFESAAVRSWTRTFWPVRHASRSFPI